MVLYKKSIKCRYILIIGIILTCIFSMNVSAGQKYSNSSSADKTYQSMESGASSFSSLYDNNSDTDGFFKKGANLLCDFYNGLRAYAPYVAALSFAVGVIVAILARHNKRWRKFAILGLAVAVPLVCIAVIFALGIFLSIFVY